MAKYTLLEVFLKGQSGDSVVLTFADIEGIIKDELPPSAYKYFRFWDTTQGNVIAIAVLNAGFQTVMVDMENKKVRFQRTQGV